MKKLSISLILVLLSASPSYAGFFNFIEDIQRGVRRVTDVIDTGNSSVNRLCTSLGLEDCNKKGQKKNDPVGSAMSVYKKWHNTLNDQEKDIVQFLVAESAQENMTSFKDFSSSKWYLSKSSQEQAKAGSIYMTLSKFIKEAAKDTSRFYAFAFCVNSGSTQCQ